MSSSDSQLAPIRARLDKFDDLAAFVQGYNQYFVKGGLLLPTRRAKPTGSGVSLQLELADGTTAFRAEGTVQKHRQNKAGETVGMVIKFTRLDARSKAILERMVAVKKGEPDPGGGEEPAAPNPTTSSPGIQPVAKAEPSLGKKDLDAMVDALDDTFDSIFSASPSGMFGTLSDDAEDVDDDMGPAGDEIIPGRPVEADEDQQATQVSAESEAAAHNTAFGIPAFTEDPIALRKKLAQTIMPEDEDQPVFEDEVPPHELDTNRVPIQQPRSITGTATTMPVEKKEVEDEAPPSDAPVGTVIGMRAIDASVPRPAPAADPDSADLAGFDEEPAGDQVTDSTPLGRIQFNKMSAAELEEQRRKKREEREASADEVQRAVATAAGLDDPDDLEETTEFGDPEPIVAPEGADEDEPTHAPNERLQQLISSVTGEHAAVNEEAPDILSQLRAQSGPVEAVSHDEDALDDLMGDEPAVNAEPVGAGPDMSVPAPVEKKKGIFARFFAWLAGLFGGGKK